MRTNTKRTSAMALACGAAVALIACGEPDAEVRIDLHDLVEHDALSVGRLDSVRLTVSPGTFLLSEARRKELVLDLSGEELTFELELGAGHWRFEMVGEELAGGATPNPTYFGDLQIDLAPLSTNELVFPFFPAGTLRVPLWIAKDTKITDALVSFAPVAPRDDQSLRYVSRIAPNPADAGAPGQVDAYEVVRVLPSGDYTATVDATADGVRYTPVEGDPILISGATGGLGVEQGTVTDWPLPFDIY